MDPVDQIRRLIDEGAPDVLTKIAAVLGFDEGYEARVVAAAQQPARASEPDAYGYAKRLAEGIWERCYRDSAPQWKPLDDVLGVLTQIDNMVAGMARASASQGSVNRGAPSE